MSKVQDIPEVAVLNARLRVAFQSQMPIPESVEANLGSALQQTLRHTGSLFRAELAAMVAEVYGLPASDGERLGIALEYFHTASLLFDDLPSMDDAMYRRGATCIHQVYGEGTAILSALALINRAYSLVWKVMLCAPPEDARLASEYLERYLGLSGILDGQSRDIHYGSTAAFRGNAQQIALEKTASLIRLPLVLPAILGGAPAQQRHLLHRLAKFWGLAYQALDDLKDVLKEPQDTGKSTHRDQLLHRPNVALELGIRQAIARHHRLSLIAKQHISRLTALNPRLRPLKDVSAQFDAETKTTLQEIESTACYSSS